MVIPLPRAILDPRNEMSIGPWGQDLRTNTFVEGVRPISESRWARPLPPLTSTTFPSSPSRRKASGSPPPEIEPLLFS